MMRALVERLACLLGNHRWDPVYFHYGEDCPMLIDRVCVRCYRSE